MYSALLLSSCFSRQGSECWDSSSLINVVSCCGQSQARYAQWMERICVTTIEDFRVGFATSWKRGLHASETKCPIHACNHACNLVPYTSRRGLHYWSDVPLVTFVTIVSAFLMARIDIGPQHVIRIMRQLRECLPKLWCSPDTSSNPPEFARIEPKINWWWALRNFDSLISQTPKNVHRTGPQVEKDNEDKTENPR